MSKPTFGYWNIRGFGQPIRFLIQYLGVDHNEKSYIDDGGEKREEWFKKDKFALGLDFPNIPYWIDGDFKLTETKAILKHLSRKYDPKLMPKDETILARSEMLENVLADVWQILVAYAYISTDEVKKSFPENSTVKLEQLSKFIGSNKFAVGSQITYVDFLLYEILYHYTMADASLVKPFANLMSYMKNFESIPQISKFIASPNYLKGPCFSSQAKIQF